MGPWDALEGAFRRLVPALPFVSEKNILMWNVKKYSNNI